MNKRLFVLLVSVFLICMPLFSACSPGHENLSSKEKEGHKLFTEFCQQCHRLQSPKLHTAEYWPETVNRMQRYMEEKKDRIRVISDSQKETLLIYLKSQARK